MSSNALRFGEIVRARRLALNDLTQLDVWKRGGPSNSTLTAIESGQWKRNPATFRKLDLALEWEPGSARRTFDEGGDPTPLPAPMPTKPRTPTSARDLTDDELLAELTYRVKRYAASHREESDHGHDDAGATKSRAGGSPARITTHEVAAGDHQELRSVATRQPVDDPPG